MVLFKASFYKFNSKKPVLYDRNNNDDVGFDSNSDKYISLYEQNMGLNKNLPLTKLSTKIPLVENFNQKNKYLSPHKKFNFSINPLLLVKGKISNFKF